MTQESGSVGSGTTQNNVAHAGAGATGSAPPAQPNTPSVNGQAGGTLAPEQAKERILDLRSNDDFRRRYVTGDRAAVREMTDLHKLAHPDPVAEGKAGQSAETQSASPLLPDSAKPEDYVLPHLGDPTSETQALGKSIRGHLAAAGFTKETGSFIASEAARTDGMSVQERASLQKQSKEILQRLWGENYNSKIEVARQFLEDLETRSPGALDHVERTGALNSAGVLSQVVLHAERLSKMKGAK